MCFRIKHSDLTGSTPKVRVAKESIVCYKVVMKGPRAKKTAKSQFRNFNYRIGKSAKAKMDIIGSTIEAGLHSYVRRPGGESGDNTVMLCVIPKGAQYFKNKSEYCSTKITPVAFL